MLTVSTLESSLPVIEPLIQFANAQTIEVKYVQQIPYFDAMIRFYKMQQRLRQTDRYEEARLYISELRPSDVILKYLQSHTIEKGWKEVLEFAHYITWRDPQGHCESFMEQRLHNLTCTCPHCINGLLQMTHWRLAPRTTEKVLHTLAPTFHTLLVNKNTVVGHEDMLPKVGLALLTQISYNPQLFERVWHNHAKLLDEKGAFEWVHQARDINMKFRSALEQVLVEKFEGIITHIADEDLLQHLVTTAMRNKSRNLVGIARGIISLPNFAQEKKMLQSVVWNLGTLHSAGVGTKDVIDICHKSVPAEETATDRRISYIDRKSRMGRRTGQVR